MESIEDAVEHDGEVKMDEGNGTCFAKSVC